MIIIITIAIFMQYIYNYIPETNHVSRVCSVAAVLYLQLMEHFIWNRLSVERFAHLH